MGSRLILAVPHEGPQRGRRSGRTGAFSIPAGCTTATPRDGLSLYCRPARATGTGSRHLPGFHGTDLARPAKPAPQVRCRTMAELRARATPVQVSGARVSSESVQGTVVPATSLAAEPRSALLGVLGELGLRSGQVLGLDVEAVTPPAVAGRRSRSAAAAAAVTGRGDTGEVLVELPPPALGQGQVLLVDNGGAVSWILPERPADGTRSRSAAVTRFRVPIAPPRGGQSARPAWPPGQAGAACPARPHLRPGR